MQHELLESPIAVYNFEVQEHHNYFIGDSAGVLVHNLCAKPSNYSQLDKGVNKLNDVARTGQKHHIFGNKGYNLMKKNPNLKNIQRNDYIIKGLDANSHKGYQNWHRLYDKKIVDWLNNNPLASIESFENVINELCQSSDFISRFGKIFVKLR